MSDARFSTLPLERLEAMLRDTATSAGDREGAAAELKRRFEAELGSGGLHSSPQHVPSSPEVGEMRQQAPIAGLSPTAGRSSEPAAPVRPSNPGPSAPTTSGHGPVLPSNPPPPRRSHKGAIMTLLVIAAIISVGGVLLLQRDKGFSPSVPSDTYSSSEPLPSTSDSIPNSPSTSTFLEDPSWSADQRALLALVPLAMEKFCHVGGPDAGGIVATVTCDPTDVGGPSSVVLFAYDTAADMNTAFVADYGGEAPVGDCSTAIGYRSTWQLSGVDQGPLACYQSKGGRVTVAWGSTSRAVLATAGDSTWSVNSMYAWWTAHAAWLR